MSTFDEPTLQRLIKLGATAPEVLNKEHTDRDPLVVIPEDMKVESLAQFYPPKRIVQAVVLLEAGSFIEYVNRFKDADTLIFSDVTEFGVTFKAVLDYHQAPVTKAEVGPNPRYCKHTATFQAIETPEWKTWKAANGQALSQLDFATFLENNEQLFVKPNGAELLELVRTLHGHCNARFSTAIRSETGAYSVSYEEDVVIKGNAGGTASKPGEMKLPPQIEAGMSVFQGASPYKIKARLKATATERKLTLRFETIQFHAVVRESILLLVKQVADKTGIVPMLGRP